MFDLNEAITAWRHELSARSVSGRSDLDELEAHLCDQMDALQSRGLSGQEAFWVAAHRLGSAAALAPEYAKVNPLRPWLSRLCWVAGGILAWHVLGAVASIAASGCAYLGHLGGLTGYRLGGLVVGAQFLALGAAAVCGVAVWWLVSCRNGTAHALRGSIGTWPAALGGAGAILLLTLGSLVASMLQFRGMGAAEIGQVAVVRSIAGLTWSVLLPILLVAAILWLRRRSWKESAPAVPSGGPATHAVAHED